MGNSGEGLTQFVSSILDCNSFSTAFSLFEYEVDRMGLEGVLYTYIPKTLIDNGFAVKPVYEVSKNYAPDYLLHYTEARFDRCDPLISAVQSGVTEPINWWGPLCQQYINGCADSAEVLATSRDYGIRDGLTLPLMSGQHGVAGASFIFGDERGFDLLLNERLDELRLYSRVFHNVVAANTQMNGHFSKPLIESFSNTELQLLIGLAKGKTMATISTELNRGGKYLEQVMLSLRRKMSGVDSGAAPEINRNQLLYYAGLLNILEYNELDL